MNGFLLRLKLLLHDRTAGICYVAAAVVMLAVLTNLSIHAEERSSIPIGLVCSDSSEEARKVCESICASDSVYVYREDLETLSKMMTDGYVNCIFVIKEGFGDMVRAGNSKELVTVYAPLDDKISSLICDIVAGCMMETVCINKTFRQYSKLDTRKLNDEAAQGYTQLERDELFERISELRTDDMFIYGFDTTFVDKDSDERNVSITNGMVYRQAVAGMVAMLLALICFCACNGIAADREKNITARRNVLPGRKIGLFVSEALALYVYSLPLCVAIVIFLSKNTDASSEIRLLVLNLLYLLVCVVFFTLAAYAIGSITIYQIIGSMVVIVFGACGFIYVFSGFLGTEIFNIVPNSVYIRYFIRMIG